MKSPTVAIIVICYNNRDLLAECFNSVRNQSYKHIKTIMVDNDSKDDSVEFTKANYEEVEVIETRHNNGFAKGNNIGFKHAFKDKDTDYVVALNSDATLDKDWVKNMVEFLSSRPKAALAQGLTLDYYNHNIIDSTHIFLNQAGIGVQQNWREPIEKANLNFKKVFGVNAAAAIYTRRFLEAQPYDEFFDESFFMYLEDVDISARATVLGWDNYFVKEAVAYHMGSASSSKNPGFSIYMTFRNNMAVILKNMPFKTALRLVLKMPRVDYLYIKLLREKGRGGEVKPLIKGRAVSIVRVPIYLIKRRKISKRIKIDENYLWKLMESGD